MLSPRAQMAQGLLVLSHNRSSLSSCAFEDPAIAMWSGCDVLKLPKGAARMLGVSVELQNRELQLFGGSWSNT